MSHDLYAKRRAIAHDLERQVARAVVAAGAEAPDHPNDPRIIAKAPGDPDALRGIPLMGERGVTAVRPGTRPGDSTWRIDELETSIR